MKGLLKIILPGLFCALCFVPRAQAADLASLESQVQQLNRIVHDLQLTVENQQREIAVLKGQEPQPFKTPAAMPSAGSRSLQGRWNPDIGAVADTVLKIDNPHTDTEGADRLSVRELELVLGSAVDPYSRLDATISFSDFEETSLEEAYYTHFGLPLDITARVGRFKPLIGKAIPVHRDSLDTVDEPLVIQRWFGVEGLAKSGVDLKKSLDLPWASSGELALGALEGGAGEGGALFGTTRRRPALYGHFKNYWDVTDVTGLELGISHIAGSRDDDAAFEVNVTGFDGTFIYRFADQRHFKLQGEAFHAVRSESFVERTDDTTGSVFLEDLDGNRNLWGGYALADLRFNPRWATGFRFDRVQLVDDPIANPESGDTGYSGYLTFYQSEFARWRAQISHFDLSDGSTDNQVLVQGIFAIGEHKHKLQ